jgi:hypothetical protein
LSKQRFRFLTPFSASRFLTPFSASIVIMVSRSWSKGDNGNTGTVLTVGDTAAMQLTAGPQLPPSEAELSMTRPPRPLVLGGNGTSASASGESFSYAFATMTFSVTISNTTMDNDAPGGGLSAPTGSLNLSLGSGSFSTNRSDVTVQESSESDTSSYAKSAHVKEENVSGSATKFTLNLGGDDDASCDDEHSSAAATPSQIPAALRDNHAAEGITTAYNSADAAADENDLISFSRVSHNSQQKTTLYATQSGQQSDTSESLSSTKADIEDSSSGSTSLSFSISGFDYETTSKSKSQFSYISESHASSDSPVGYDGRPSSHSESDSSQVIETLDESSRTFGFGIGSEGFDVTNEYSSNETVSDVLKSESTSDSWRLVYPTITSSLAMMSNPQSTAPYWVAGPELEMTSGHNIQFNYGGNLEDGFEGSYSETTGFSQEMLKQDGTVDHYEYTLPVEKTYTNTKLGNESRSSSILPDGSPESTRTVTSTPGTSIGSDSPANTGNNAQIAGFHDSYSFTDNAATAPDESKRANGSPAQKDPDELRPPTQTIVIVHVEPYPVATDTDPSQYLVNQTKDQFEKRLKEIENQLNNLMKSEKLPITFKVFPANGVPWQELTAWDQHNGNNPHMIGDGYSRYDWYIQLVKSTNETFSQNPLMATTDGIPFTTADEFATYRDPDFADRKSTFRWDIYYANAIAHEFFTFGVFGDFHDIGTNTPLTGRSGTGAKLIDLTPEECRRIIEIILPR